MSPEKSQFIDFLIQQGVLLYGEFTTKSGRKSPYFLNLGNLYRGSQLTYLAQTYANTIFTQFGSSVTNLFGPAYKGIPLGTAIALSLWNQFHYDVSVSFNRKEVKDHGEGGNLLGFTYTSQVASANASKETVQSSSILPALKSEKVVIVEDVTTAGTSIHEIMPLLTKHAQVEIIGLVVAVDRREKTSNGNSALSELSAQYGFKAQSIVDIWDIYHYMKKNIEVKNFKKEQIEAMEQYIEKYVVK